jgi:hypothetical protein
VTSDAMQAKRDRQARIMRIRRHKGQAYAEYGPLADLACALDYLHAATDAPSIAPMCRGHGSPQFFKSVIGPALVLSITRGAAITLMRI